MSEGNGKLLGPDGEILSRGPQAEKAIDQFQRRQLREYEEQVKKLVALARSLDKVGQTYLAEVAARAALLLAEVYVARRERVFNLSGPQV